MRTFTSLFILSGIMLTSSLQAQYCMLPGRTAYSAEQPGIKLFKLSTLNRVSSNVESMSTVVVTTGDTTALLRGHTYTVTMYHNRDSIVFPTTRNNIRVWIDYNSNSNFDDAGETVISSDFQTVGFYTGTFTVPMTAPVGTTRLRATAKMSSDAGHTIPTSCDVPADPIGYHGEMEDYVVKIMATTAINDPGAYTSNVIVYPNPTANKVSISLDMALGPISMDLLDVTGKLIGHVLHEDIQSSQSYTFDIDNYTSAPGTYLLKVTTAAGPQYHRITKTN